MLRRNVFMSAFLFVATLLISTSAIAKADLDLSVTASGGTFVYDTVRYDFDVYNRGNRTAKNVELTVDLPETQTSPTVHVMGIVGAASSNCSLSGTTLTCAIGTVKRKKTKSVFVEVAWPVSATPLSFDADVTTTVNESDLSNNSLTENVSVDYYLTPITGPVVITNRHCTGQGLIGFYECTLFPSSISSHTVTYLADGTIDFGGAAGYTGTWSQVLDDRLQFAYYQNGQLVAAFHGYGVGGGCFEGLTLFPGSSWRSPYEVCM